MENPLVKESSVILHKTPYAKYPVIISTNDAPLFEMWRFHKKNYKYPAFLASSYAFLKGITKLMYLPFTEDFGLMVYDSTLHDDFKCIFQIYIDHELKMLAWGRGYVDLQERHWGHTHMFSKQFESPSEFKSHSHKEYKNIKKSIINIFPQYRVVNWSMRFKQSIFQYHKKQVDTISEDIAIPDVKQAILKQALPQWPVEEQPLMTKSDLIGGVEVLDSWESKWIGINDETTSKKMSLPHRWGLWYVIDLHDIVDCVPKL